MKKNPTPFPKDPATGHIDKEAVEALFMSSAFLDWTRFAEDQGWDPLRSRVDFPVATWQKNKRDKLASAQMEILSGLIFERRFKWTHSVIKTLDDYPEFIDQAKALAQAKMFELSEMFKDWQTWKKDPNQTMYKGMRRKHPWEHVSPMDISMMAKAVKELTEAKLKALMLDKWAISKLDIPSEDMKEPGGETEAERGPMLTVEGKGELTMEQLQGWFDKWHDKPQDVPAIEEPETPPKEVT
jgi:hypothetical protein